MPRAAPTWGNVGGPSLDTPGEGHPPGIGVRAGRTQLPSGNKPGTDHRIREDCALVGKEKRPG